MKNPIWIIVTSNDDAAEDGDLFEGHQLHWANCQFSNATAKTIENYLIDEGFFGTECVFEIREMTDEEVVKYPEAIVFQQHLIKEYGEA